MTIISTERRKKLGMIKQIIEGEKKALDQEPPLEWYGRIFDELYDAPSHLLSSKIRINNWINTK